ncbi:hypothetical protein [Photobacterium leiognathi]|uniref:hypothetical protein n=1 Tax=Photobacterium leiognathi TaxID=553611 RepID=UPI003F738FE6
MLADLKQIARKNIINKSYIGQGYHNTFTPNAILRNVLEKSRLVHRLHPLPT